jgi:hypothetical protein
MSGSVRIIGMPGTVRGSPRCWEIYCVWSGVFPEATNPIVSMSGLDMDPIAVWSGPSSAGGAEVTGSPYGVCTTVQERLVPNL